MPIIWSDSSAKHDIPREYILNAIGNYEGKEEIEGYPNETTTVYVGHPHGQTDRYIEVIVATWPPNNMRIFHAMPLTDLYRHLI
jgi:hypothetical protein